MNADLNVIIENVIQNKNGIMISVNVSVKNQQNIACAKKTMLETLAYVLVIVTKTVALVNT